ncbi:hypothetical protein [Halalkalirubrum salinum]|uniref:hypothetical protein n=1 Tax=Halalkalirubrum salinum TaxID=2563889 RepID=UPI001485AB42|nr:hypothetical protein [Halalkalirubrum salinum]
MNIPATVAALVAVAFFAIALFFMSVSNYGVAGFSFLAASMTIYFREQRLVGQ